MHFLLNRPPARGKDGWMEGQVHTFIQRIIIIANSVIVFIIHLELYGSVWTTEQPHATVD